MPQFHKLFEPLRIGKLDLKNRIYMLGTSLGYTPDYHVNDRLKAFYRERAQGGAALIAIGMALPSPMNNSTAEPGQADLGIWDDSFIPGFKQAVGVIHEYEAKAVCQIGLQYHWQKSTAVICEMVGPSAVSTRRGIEPRELSATEIQQIIGEFGDAVKRAREAGFDAVEYHAGIGYLINRFLSPLTNRRTDDYGGSLEKRLRFLLEIIKDSQKKAGTDFTYFCRLSADEFMPGGNTLEESRQIAVLLEKSGFDCLNIQVGWHESAKPMLQNFVAPGAFAYVSEAIKKAVSIPVAAAYRINSPAVSERILTEGKADLIGMCRALIADPYLPRKAEMGSPDDIRPCIACGYCMDVRLDGESLACSVNPRVGKEAAPRSCSPATPKRVLVVGGGPAGMEAAALAARRGHRVTLVEGNRQLGGQLLAGAKLSYKDDIARYIRYLVKELDSAGVEVKLSERVAPDLVNKLNPDVVILAAGAIPLATDIPGIGEPNVVTATQVLNGEKIVGANVVVIGSGMVGCEVAEFLREQGKKVIILEMQPKPGSNIGRSVRPFLLGRLREAGIVIESNIRIEQITAQGVKARRDDKELSFAADSVVLAMGMQPNDGLFQELKNGRYELYPIGDCVKPGRIAGAVADAARIANAI